MSSMLDKMHIYIAYWGCNLNTSKREEKNSAWYNSPPPNAVPPPITENVIYLALDRFLREKKLPTVAYQSQKCILWHIHYKLIGRRLCRRPAVISTETHVYLHFIYSLDTGKRNTICSTHLKFEKLVCSNLGSQSFHSFYFFMMEKKSNILWTLV